MDLIGDIYKYFQSNPAGTKAVDEGITTKKKVSPEKAQSLMSTVRAATQFSPIIPETPIDELLFSILSKRQTPSMESRMQNIRSAQDIVDKPEKLTGQDYLLQGLMGVSDILSGTKYAPELYARHLSKDQEKLAQRLDMEKAYKGMGDTEVDLLKTQFQNLGELSEDQRKAAMDAWQQAYKNALLEYQMTPEVTEKEGAKQDNTPPVKGKVGGGKKLKILTPKDTKAITDAFLIPDRVKEMISDYDALLGNKTYAERIGSAAAGVVSESDYQKWSDRKKDFLTQLARSQQSGVLSDQDIRFADQQFPTIKDNKKEAHRKLNNINMRISAAVKSYVSALRPNYDVSMFEADFRKAPPSDKTEAAKAWLKKNPNHPKAAAVRKKLGL